MDDADRAGQPGQLRPDRRRRAVVDDDQLRVGPGRHRPDQPGQGRRRSRRRRTDRDDHRDRQVFVPHTSASSCRIDSLDAPSLGAPTRVARRSATTAAVRSHVNPATIRSRPAAPRRRRSAGSATTWRRAATSPRRLVSDHQAPPTVGVHSAGAIRTATGRHEPTGAVVAEVEARSVVGHDHRQPRGHRLGDRQPEPFTAVRVDERVTAPEEIGHLVAGQVAVDHLDRGAAPGRGPADVGFERRRPVDGVRAERLDDEADVVGRAERAEVGLEQDVDALALDAAADEEEPRPLRRRQREPRAVGPEPVDVDPVRDDVDPVGRHAAGHGAVAAPPRRHPELVDDVADRADPLGRQLAELPRLHQDEATARRRREVRRPLMANLDRGGRRDRVDRTGGRAHGDATELVDRVDRVRRSFAGAGDDVERRPVGGQAADDLPVGMGQAVVGKDVADPADRRATAGRAVVGPATVPRCRQPGQRVGGVVRRPPVLLRPAAVRPGRDPRGHAGPELVQLDQAGDRPGQPVGVVGVVRHEQRRRAGDGGGRQPVFGSRGDRDDDRPGRPEPRRRIGDGSGWQGQRQGGGHPAPGVVADDGDRRRPQCGPQRRCGHPLPAFAFGRCHPPEVADDADAGTDAERDDRPGREQRRGGRDGWRHPPVPIGRPGGDGPQHQVGVAGRPVRIAGVDVDDEVGGGQEAADVGRGGGRRGREHDRVEPVLGTESGQTGRGGTPPAVVGCADRRRVRRRVVRPAVHDDAVRRQELLGLGCRLRVDDGHLVPRPAEEMGDGQRPDVRHLAVDDQHSPAAGGDRRRGARPGRRRLGTRRHRREDVEDRHQRRRDGADLGTELGLFRGRQRDDVGAERLATAPVGERTDGDGRGQQPLAGGAGPVDRRPDERARTGEVLGPEPG